MESTNWTSVCYDAFQGRLPFLKLPGVSRTQPLATGFEPGFTSGDALRDAIWKWPNSRGWRDESV